MCLCIGSYAGKSFLMGLMGRLETSIITALNFRSNLFMSAFLYFRVHGILEKFLRMSC